MDFVWLLLSICQRKFIQKSENISWKKTCFLGTKNMGFFENLRLPSEHEAVDQGSTANETLGNPLGFFNVLWGTVM